MEPLPHLTLEQLNEFIARIQVGTLHGSIERVDLAAFWLQLDLRPGVQREFITDGVQAYKLVHAREDGTGVHWAVTQRHIASTLRGFFHDGLLPDTLRELQAAASRNARPAPGIMEWLYGCEQRLHTYFPAAVFEMAAIVELAFELEARSALSSTPA